MSQILCASILLTESAGLVALALWMLATGKRIAIVVERPRGD